MTRRNLSVSELRRLATNAMKRIQANESLLFDHITRHLVVCVSNCVTGGAAKGGTSLVSHLATEHYYCKTLVLNIRYM